MRKSQVIRIAIYLLAILIPILSMVNCTGWGTNDMKVDHCYIDTPALRELSQNSYAFLFFSSFMFGLPIGLYVGAVFLIVEIPLFLFSRRRKKKFTNSLRERKSKIKNTLKEENISPFVIIPFIGIAFIIWYFIASL